MTGPKPIFSLAFQYRLPYAGLAVKGQASNKFRFPTLNDRYWQPGGNRELLPETGMGYDIGLVWKSATPSNSSLSVSSLLYIQHINNWIQWVPAGTYWSPQNIRQVTCRGLELDLTGRWNLGQAGLIARTMYTYTESFDMGLPYAETRYQRQLAYVPFHMLRIQTGINSGRFEAAFGYKYMGRRFTTDDHDPWLDLAPCHLADFTIRYSIVKGNNRIVISGFVDNLFDTSYQLVRAYPAPGRSFCISVNYLFNQKNAKND
jgi:iron complex outermembrane receptor protein